MCGRDCNDKRAYQRIPDAIAVAHVHILDAALRDARPLLEAAPATLGVRVVIVRNSFGGDGRRDDNEESREGRVHLGKWLSK